MLVCISRVVIGCFIGAIVPAESKPRFLGQVVSENIKVFLDDVKGELLAELKSTFRGGGDARIEKLTEALRPLFTALPKDESGNLKRSVARFALHRLFTSRHGWFITGLEPNADTSNGTLRDWVPAYLITTIEKLLGRNSADLNELAVLAATFEDLIHKEAIGRLEEIYKLRSLPREGKISEEQVDMVIKTYVSIYTSAGNTIAKTTKDIEEGGVRLHPKTVEWLLTIKRNTSSEVELDFNSVAEIAEIVGERYGSFEDHECNEVKTALLQIGDRKTGRVKLSDFYAKGMYGYWRFNEKIEYLRFLGVLDESDPKTPRVVVPNYVVARHNCLQASGFYAICCHNECESLMGSIEAKIKAPRADVKQLAELVSQLSSATVQAPWNISGTLFRRLHDVGASNGGQVPLHGRLFAQWMHHAFPRECPYPHESTINPQTPDEWTKQAAPDSVQASKEEILKFVDPSKQLEVELPWSQVESLIAPPPPESQVSLRKMKELLVSELQATFRSGASKDRLVSLEEALRPMFTSLPKNKDGNLEHAVARFALHRLFMQQHGWFITGLEPTAGADASPAGGLKTWLPSSVMDTVEKLLGTQSVDLRELAVLAATFEDIIHQEAIGRLEQIYKFKNVSLTATLNAGQIDQVITTYFAIYTSAGNATANTPEQVQRTGAKLHTKTKEWLATVQKNVSANSEIDFNTTKRIVERIGEQYGSFNDHACKEVKSVRLNISDRKTARARLAAFYQTSDSYWKFRYGSWKFRESIDWLRELGALDESIPGQPLVIVPNYVSARPNCLVVSSFYAICCPNECESLMGELERKIGAPNANPGRIADIVTRLRSDTVEAPWNLSATMSERLHKVAASNAGHVPLHGRLFAQWMHHAYPRECPYPHEAAVNPQTPNEWMKESGGLASEEEVKAYTQPELTAEIKLPWSNSEELLIRPQPASEATNEGVKRALVAEIEQTLKSSGERHDFEEALRPMFQALPKNTHGLLEHGVARFALHRLFVKERGWFIAGLEPSTDMFRPADTSSSGAAVKAAHSTAAGSLREWVPAYLMDNIEKLLQTHGVNLHELAVLAAVFEDIIHKEEVGRLEDIYKLRNIPINGEIDDRQAENIITTYLSVYTSAGNQVAKSVKDIEERGVRLHPTTIEWLATVKQNASLHQGKLDFSHATRVVEEIGMQYGAFIDQQCQSVRTTLLEVGDWNTGRVRLSDFYKKAGHGLWKFNEKIEFLRTLGVLDESDPMQPTVIVSNYVSSRHNCMMASNFYSVCCANKCEDLMGSIESKIGAPRADPYQIGEIVMSLPSDTVETPRTLSSTLLRRLNDVSASNGGQVPIHGRLFAQWMHHAYPRECPYPHDTAMNPQTPNEWMKGSELNETIASEEEMQNLVDSEKCSPDDFCEADLPWSDGGKLIEDRPVFGNLSKQKMVDRPNDAASGRSIQKVLFFLTLLTAIAGALMFFKAALVGADSCGKKRDYLSSSDDVGALKLIRKMKSRMNEWRDTTSNAMVQMAGSIV